MKGQAFARRLCFALAGAAEAVRRERSLRVHVAMAAGVLAVLLATRPPALWWALAALAVGGVITAELFNTGLEILCDRLHPDIHPEIKAAKDIAAAAVLAASLAALGVAIAFILS